MTERRPLSVRLYRRKRVDIRTISPKRYDLKVGKNLEKSESERVQAVIEYPSVEGFEPYAPTRGKSVDGVGLVKKFVKEIYNLSHNGEPITSGAELVKKPKRAFDDYVVDLYSEIILQSGLTPETEKN